MIDIDDETILTIRVLISGYCFKGKLIKETDQSIEILDFKTNKKMFFPKEAIYFIRGYVK